MKRVLITQISNQLQVEQQTRFAESCLPRTMALAKENRACILPHLDHETRAFPFEDRILIWLHPYRKKQVEQFHRSNGKDMEEMFSTTPHKFQRFDDVYFEKLRGWLKQRAASSP